MFTEKGIAKLIPKVEYRFSSADQDITFNETSLEHGLLPKNIEYCLEMSINCVKF